MLYEYNLFYNTDGALSVSTEDLFVKPVENKPN